MPLFMEIWGQFRLFFEIFESKTISHMSDSDVNVVAMSMKGAASPH